MRKVNLSLPLLAPLFIGRSYTQVWKSRLTCQKHLLDKAALPGSDSTSVLALPGTTAWMLIFRNMWNVYTTTNNTTN